MYMYSLRFCSIREVELCRSIDDSLKMFMPQIYHIDCRPSKVMIMFAISCVVHHVKVFAEISDQTQCIHY